MATSSLVYTLSSDGTYYIVGTGFDNINDLITEVTTNAYSGTETVGSGLDNTWTGGVLEIPATYNGLPVLGIAGRAFEDIRNITSVVIDEGIQVLGRSSFRCTSNTQDTRLVSVSLPTTLTYLGGVSFQYRKSLSSINIQNTAITHVYAHSFFHCESLTSIIFSNNITDIDDSVCSYCYKLASVTLPNNMTRISSLIFDGCSNLASITIPNSVTSIGANAFNDCKKINSIIIPSGVTSIGANAFKGCIRLVEVFNLSSVSSSSSNYLQSYCVSGGYHTTAGTSQIETINNIIYYKFSSSDYGVVGRADDSITAITLDSRCHTLLANAFSDYGNLISVDTSNITTIGASVFYNCYHLTSITLPNTLTTLNDALFDGCASLTSITIPDTVTSIGTYVFRNCISLTSITIPDTVNLITLGAHAFDYTTFPIYVYRLLYKTATNWSAYASRIQRIANTRVIDYVGGDVNSATTLTKSIPCEIGDKLLACVVYRSTFTAPQGWNLVASAPVISDGSTPAQYLSVYSKTAESTSESFTATQASSGRIYLSIINIIDRTYQEVSSLNTNGNAITNSTLTITKPSNNELLYFYGFIISNNSTTNMQYTLTGDYDYYQYYGGGARLFFVYDTKAQNTSFTMTRTNSSPSTYNTLGIELIVPTQQTNKVSFGSKNIAFSLGSNKNISISLGNTLIYSSGGSTINNAVMTANGEFLLTSNGENVIFS